MATIAEITTLKLELRPEVEARGTSMRAPTTGRFHEGGSCADKRGAAQTKPCFDMLSS
jgi:hypothetical protein